MRQVSCLCPAHHRKRQYLISGGYDGRVVVWDVTKRSAPPEPVHDFVIDAPSNEREIHAIAFMRGVEDDGAPPAPTTSWGGGGFRMYGSSVASSAEMYNSMTSSVVGELSQPQSHAVPPLRPSGGGGLTRRLSVALLEEVQTMRRNSSVVDRGSMGFLHGIFFTGGVMAVSVHLVSSVSGS